MGAKLSRRICAPSSRDSVATSSNFSGRTTASCPAQSRSAELPLRNLGSLGRASVSSAPAVTIAPSSSQNPKVQVSIPTERSTSPKHSGTTHRTFSGPRGPTTSPDLNSPAAFFPASCGAQAPEERQVSTPASLGSPPAPQPACPSVSSSSATRPASEASSAAPSSTAWESQGSMSFDSSSLHSPVSEPSPRGGMPFSRAGSERAPRIPATRTRVSPPRNSRRIFPAVAPGVPPPRSLPGRHGEATSAASAHLHSKPLRNPLRIAPMPPREGPPPSLPVERNTSLRFRVSSHPAERETSLRFRASHTRAQKARHRARQAPETVSAPVTPRPGEFSSL
eukprot:RCo046672